MNDQRGLQHGFTVEQRPPGATDAEARLEFDLAVRGSLRPPYPVMGRRCVSKMRRELPCSLIQA